MLKESEYRWLALEAIKAYSIHKTAAISKETSSKKRLLF